VLTIASGIKPGLSLILFLGLLIRFIFLYLLKDAQLVGDMQDYYRIAVELKNGQGFNSTIRAPLYPYIVSFLFILFDSSNLILVKIFQSVISLVNVILVYLLGQEIFDRRTGILAAALFCFYPTLLFYNNFILTEVLFITLFTSFLLSFTAYLNLSKIPPHLIPLPLPEGEDRGRGVRIILLALSGFLLGLTTLCRSVTLQLPLIIVPFIFLVDRFERISRKTLLTFVFLASFILVLTPWTIRNYKVHHVFIPVDLIGKINVMLGNYEYTPLNRAWDAHITQTGERAWTYPLRKEGRYDKMTEAERADWSFHEGVRFMIQHPALTLKRSFVKFCNFWELERGPSSMAVKGFLGNANIAILEIFAALGCIFQSLILLGTIFFFVYFFKDNIVTNVLFSLIVVYFTLMHSMIYGHPRYQLPLTPILFVCCANTFLRIREIGRQKRWIQFLVAASVCAFFTFVWIRQFYIHVNNLYLV